MSGSAGVIGPDAHVVIVGGGIAAARTCSALRRGGLTGPIDVVGSEPHLPYDRPPLSKDVLLGTKDDTTLPFDLEKLGVTFHTGRTATALDVERRILHTDHGGMAFDGLVIATGATPTRLPGDGPQATLRTIDDALAVRERMWPGARIVLVGASWIGAEVATAALARGCRVTAVEYDDVPLAGSVGTTVARELLPWWSSVDLRCRISVDSVTEDGVILTGGHPINADLVVVGVGVRPAIGWLEGSGVATARGVLTDERCRTNVPGVLAVGDAAERWSPRDGGHRLVEHWDDAGGAAAAAAAALLRGDEAPAFDPVPYFWSDQFGHKIQYVGRHGPDDHVRLTRSSDGFLEAATWTTPEGVRSAWLGVDLPREVVSQRQSIGRLDEILAAT